MNKFCPTEKPCIMCGGIDDNKEYDPDPSLVLPFVACRPCREKLHDVLTSDLYDPTEQDARWEDE